MPALTLLTAGVKGELFLAQVNTPVAPMTVTDLTIAPMLCCMAKKYHQAVFTVTLVNVL